jgi:hypothetical protein
MQQPSVKSNIQTDLKTSNFSIEVNESMFQMLTQKVYTDLIAAPIREWSTNAIDACIAANKPVKFDVHLPTLEESYFSVRDYGDGLSQEDILGLFSTLGASTKRHSNAYNGTFGIGRMSGLAYADAFTVESYYNGNYHSYVISIKDGVPVAVELANTITTEPNGLKLSLSVKTEDISDFVAKAENIYRYFDHVPKLNIPLKLDINYIARGDTWYLLNHTSCSKVIMGNVVYQLPYKVTNEWDFKHCLMLKVPIGTLAVNPGRESLSLDKTTFDNLNKQYAKAATEILETFKKQLDEDLPFFEKVKLYDNIKNHLPWSLRDSIATPTVTDPLVKTFGNYCSFNGCNENIDVWVYKRGYTKAVNTAKGHIAIPTSELKLLLVDTKSSFLPIIEHIRDEQQALIALRRPKGVNFEVFLQEAKALLKALRCDYEKASDYQQLVSTKSSKRHNSSSSETIYGCSINAYTGRVAANACLAKDVSYWYLPLSGSTITDPNAEHYLTAYCLLPETKSLVGIQKKYMHLVKDNPKFTPLPKVISANLHKIKFEFNSRRLLQEVRKSPHNTKPKLAPIAIKEFYDDILSVKEVLPVDLAYIELAKFYNKPVVVHTVRHTQESLLEKYPLFTVLNTYGISDAERNYYYELEYYNEQRQLHKDEQ